MQRFHVRDRFFRCVHGRFGDDLQQGCAGTIEIDTGGGVEGIVQRFSSVFFQMRARQWHHQHAAIIEACLDRTADDDRQFVLADLIALGQIRIEIILARKHAAFGDGGADSETKLDRALDRAAIGHRQGAWQGGIYEADLGVRFGAVFGGGTGEDLRLGRQLHMHFQTDHGLPFAAHATPPARPAECGVWRCQSLIC